MRSHQATTTSAPSSDRSGTVLPAQWKNQRATPTPRIQGSNMSTSSAVPIPRHPPQHGANTAHLVGASAATLMAALLAVIIADNTSFVTLKPEPPLIISDLNVSLRTVYGFPYSIGVFKDSRGRGLYSGKKDDPQQSLNERVQNIFGSHPAEALDCDEHRWLILSLQVLAPLGLAVGIILTILHLCASAPCCGRTATDARGKHLPGCSTVVAIGYVCVVVQVVTIAVLIVATAFAGVLFTKPFICNNKLIPVLEIENHFDRRYALSCLIIMVACECFALLCMLPVTFEMRHARATMTGWHLTCCVVSMAMTIALGVCVADGTSLALLKNDPPVIAGTVPSITIKDLTDIGYGVGLCDDSRSLRWTQGDAPSSWTRSAIRTSLETGHLAAVFGCSDLENMGAATGILTIICLACSGVSTALFYAIGFEAVTAPWWKALSMVLTGAVWLLSVTVLALGATLYAKKFDCNNPVLQSIQIKDHFDIGYAVPFLAVAHVMTYVVAVAARQVYVMQPNWELVYKDGLPMDRGEEEMEEDGEEEEEYGG